MHCDSEAHSSERPGLQVTRCLQRASSPPGLKAAALQLLYTLSCSSESRAQCSQDQHLPGLLVNQLLESSNTAKGPGAATSQAACALLINIAHEPAAAQVGVLAYASLAPLAVSCRLKALIAEQPHTMALSHGRLCPGDALSSRHVGVLQ